MSRHRYVTSWKQIHDALKEIYESDPAHAPEYDSEGEPSWGPVIVCKRISRLTFARWLEQNEGKLRRWWYEPLVNDEEPDMGRVVVYSLPSRVHENTAGAIITAIQRQALRAGNEIDLIDTLVATASVRSDVGDRDQEPDHALTPIGRRLEMFSNLIVEIAFKNDSLPKLREKLVRWTRPATTVQVAIGIKIFQAPGHRLAILRVRDAANPAINVVQEVEFGTNQPNPPQPLTFPLHVLYRGDAIPLALVNHVNDLITIDLVALRNTIDELVAAHNA